MYALIKKNEKIRKDIELRIIKRAESDNDYFILTEGIGDSAFPFWISFWSLVISFIKIIIYIL